VIWEKQVLSLSSQVVSRPVHEPTQPQDRPNLLFKMARKLYFIAFHPTHRLSLETKSLCRAYVSVSLRNQRIFRKQAALTLNVEKIILKMDNSG
jgi:hypothetical protein